MRTNRAVLAFSAVALLFAAGCATRRVHVLTVVPEGEAAALGGAELLSALEADLPPLDFALTLARRAGEKRAVWVVCGTNADADAATEAVDKSARWRLAKAERVRKKDLEQYFREQAAPEYVQVFTVVAAEGHDWHGGQELVEDLNQLLPPMERSMGMAHPDKGVLSAWVVCASESDAQAVREAVAKSDRWTIAKEERVRYKDLERYMADQVRDK